MKTALGPAAVLALATFGLAACAGTAERSAYVPPSPVIGSSAVDNVYVSNVERIARRQGIKVTWVNAPLKHSDPAESRL